MRIAILIAVVFLVGACLLAEEQAAKDLALTLQGGQRGGVSR